MFGPAGARSASAYKQMGLHTTVDAASPHALIMMLFDGLQQTLKSLVVTLDNKSSNEEKMRLIEKSIRIIQEGLLAPLDKENGGELAENLSALYEYCINRLVLANVKNDVQLVKEVQDLLDPVAKAWQEIAPQTGA